MLSLDEKLERPQRLLRRLEEDQPLLALRVAELGAEQQESSKRFAAQMIAQTRAELQRLVEAQADEADLSIPASAD